MLEALADIHLLGSTSDYIKRMQYEEVCGEKRFYDRLLTSHSLSTADQEIYREALEVCMKRYRPLHDIFRKQKLTEADKFSLAGLPYLLSPYTMLCGFAHNDLSALALRHHQADEGMAIRATLPDDTAFLILSLASLALLLAVEPIGAVALFPTGRYEQYLRELMELHDELMMLAP